MKRHEVEYIDLPITTDSYNNILDLEDDPDHPNIQNRGDVVRIIILIKEKMQRASVNQLRVGTLE